MKRANYEYEIRRIAAVYDVKPACHEDLHAKRELPEQCRTVLGEIAEHATALARQPVAINGNSLDDLKRGSRLRSLRANDRHLIALPRQCGGFRPHPAIERHG